MDSPGLPVLLGTQGKKEYHRNGSFIKIGHLYRQIQKAIPMQYVCMQP